MDAKELWAKLKDECIYEVVPGFDEKAEALIASALSAQAARIKELEEAIGWIMTELRTGSMGYEPSRFFALSKLQSALDGERKVGG